MGIAGLSEEISKDFDVYGLKEIKHLKIKTKAGF
jgi:hypothetical protein